jgi:phosphate transport system substrate-binding protein
MNTNNMRKQFTPMALVVGVSILAALSQPQQVAAQISLHGSANVGQVLSDKKADIESKSGQKIQIVSKNAGLGLKDLVEGKANLAMVAGSLKGAAKGVELTADNLSGLNEFPIGQDKIIFVVHPSNGVKSLSTEQVKAILTGATTNWKDVGGRDAAIKVFALGPMNASRIALNEQLLGEAVLATGAVVRSTPKDIVPMVAQVPDAIGFIGTANLGPGVQTLTLDKALPFPLLLVSKGAPTAEQKAVIDAARGALESSNFK